MTSKQGIPDRANGPGDWRVTISFASLEQAERAKILFPRHKVADDARRRLGHRIAVGAGGSQVFLYAGTEDAAREAERIARDVLARHDFRADFAIHRWHPLEEEWEDPDAAMPRTVADRQAEQQRLADEETAESLASGVAQWEARAQLPSHSEAVALAAKLRGEGRPVVLRWKFLVVGANNEPDAQELADQIRREAPAGSTVRAEHSRVYLPFMGF
jgi:hypothetical protein